MLFDNDDSNSESKEGRDDKMTIKFLRGSLSAKQTQLDTVRMEKEKLENYRAIIERMVAVVHPKTDVESVDLDKFEEEIIKTYHEVTNCRTILQNYKLRETELVINASHKEKRIKSLTDQVKALRQELYEDKNASENIAASLAGSAIKEETKQGKISKRDIRKTFTDPIINANFQRLHDQVSHLKKKVEALQNELKFANFDANSRTGRSLMRKCEKLLSENTNFGQIIRQSKTKQAEQRCKMLQKFNAELSSNFVQSQDSVKSLQAQVDAFRVQQRKRKRDETEEQQPDGHADGDEIMS